MDHLLFLAHRIPYPPDKGEKIRALRILDHLSRSFHVHLGCFADNPEDFSYLPALKSRTASLACFPLDKIGARNRALLGARPGKPLSLGYFHNASLRMWVEETLARTPIRQAFVFSAAMAPYVMSQAGLPKILDMVDVDSEKFAAYADAAAPPMKWLWAREARTLLNFERRAARVFDCTLFVSREECARFVELAPECVSRTDWVENGVDLAEFSPENDFSPVFESERPAIVFTGTMDYRPNVEAVTWFAEAVMPRLSSRHSKPIFYIVGADPAPAVRRLAARESIVVTGRVPDTRPYLAHAALVVAPLRIGRGIQNKVLQAMAMGRPVLASPQGFEGVRAEPGRDLLVAAGPEETARLAGEILDGQHPGLGQAARRAVSQNHDWAATLQRLDRLTLAPREAAGFLKAQA